MGSRLRPPFLGISGGAAPSSDSLGTSTFLSRLHRRPSPGKREAQQPRPPSPRPARSNHRSPHSFGDPSSPAPGLCAHSRCCSLAPGPSGRPELPGLAGKILNLPRGEGRRRPIGSGRGVSGDTARRCWSGAPGAKLVYVRGCPAGRRESCSRVAGGWEGRGGRRLGGSGCGRPSPARPRLSRPAGEVDECGRSGKNQTLSVCYGLIRKTRVPFWS